MVRTVEHILRKAISTIRHSFSRGYEVFAAGNMAHVGKLIQHWAEMVSVFNSDHRSRPQGRMTSSEFDSTSRWFAMPEMISIIIEPSRDKGASSR